MDMGCTVSYRQKLKTSCISMALLLVFCSTLINGVTEVPVSSCIPTTSTLGETALANCRTWCFRGGRGGQDGKSCGYSTDLVDMACSIGSVNSRSPVR